MIKYFWLISLLASAAIGCSQQGSEKTATPRPTATPKPTATPSPTASPSPTEKKAVSAQPAQKGPQAPALKIAQWLKGEPVTLGEDKGPKLCVVEFWATWCPPCLRSIPHLTELQKKYKAQGVVFVGISDETAEEVKPFMERMGEKMNYTVAVDNNQETIKAYLNLYGIETIPHAFIISQSGEILWHGNPLDDIEGEITKNLGR